MVIKGSCTGTFAVGKNLTLKGSSATLDAQGGGTALTVSFGTVEVVGLTITGGTGTNGRGGGIYNSGTLTMRRDTLSANSASFGGGIFSEGILTMTHSTVSGNEAPEGGGGIWNGGPGTVVGSTVSGNSGVGIYNRWDSTLLVESSRMIENSYGGINNDGTVTLIGSTVSMNAGVGVFNSDGSLTVVSSAIKNNVAPGDYGGGIRSEGPLTIVGSTINGNTAELGGGIFNDGVSVTLVSSTVAGNKATDSGGGIYDYWGGDPFVITDSTIGRNKAGIAGGGIYNEGSGQVILTASILGRNRGASGPDCYADYPAGYEGVIGSNGYSLVGIADECGFVSGSTDQLGTGSAPLDPMLKLLTVNGGSTRTMALDPASPAVDAILVGATAADGAPVCPASGTTDQRGVARPQGAGCDIGAYELKP